MARAGATRERNEKAHVPRLFWVEDEFRTMLREAELDDVRRLVSDIESGSIEGLEWWAAIHTTSDESESLPALVGYGRQEPED